MEDSEKYPQSKTKNLLYSLHIENVTANIFAQNLPPSRLSPPTL